MEQKSLAPTLAERSAVLPARLVVITPTDRFTRVLLRPSLSIGRSPDVDIRIHVEFISGLQARLEKEGDTYKYIQVGKTNPTFFHGQPVTEQILRDGDLLTIGPEKGPRVTIQYESPKSNTTMATLDGQSGIRGPAPEGGRFLGTVALDKKILIGRDPKNDLVLESMHISRQHAQVEPQGDRHILKDLGSINGTYVNGDRTSERKLQEGDVIRIGHFKLIYQGGELRGYDEERAVRLDARKVVKQLNDSILLNDISLSVLPGELVGIVGTSGSGKSTLMDALNGVRPASSGVVLVNGADLYRQFDAIRSLLGYVPQFPTLHDALPLEKALFFSGRLRFPPDVEDEVVHQRAKEAMQALEISDRAQLEVGRLSGGQQKRASIAAELMTEPGLFFLDEPASGLDPGLTRKLMEIIRKLADEGRTVILVTHDTESLSLCDVMVFLNQGRVIYVGRPEDAPAHFGAKNLGEIYTIVSSQQKTPADWEELFKKSPKYQEYVLGRQENTPEPPPEEKKQQLGPIKVKSRLSSWQQWKVLLRRYATLWSKDVNTLALLLLQVPIIASLLNLVFHSESMSVPPGLSISMLQSPQLAGAQSLIFPPMPLFMAAAVTWFGALSASREIVKELPVFRRERLAGLRSLPYLLSKMSVLSLLCLLQTVLFFLVLQMKMDFSRGLTEHGPGVLFGARLEILLTLSLTSLTAMGLGLLISASSENPDRALGFVPLLLIPQLILAGIPSDAPFYMQWLSHLSIARWAFEAMGSTMGYGGAAFPQESSYLLSRWAGLVFLWLLFTAITWRLLSKRKLA